MAEFGGAGGGGGQSTAAEAVDHRSYTGHPALAGRRASTEETGSHRGGNGAFGRQHRQLSVTASTGRHRPASLSPFRPVKSNTEVQAEPESSSATSGGSSSGLFNWRKRYAARRSSSSCVVPAPVPPQPAVERTRTADTSSRRMSQPAAFSLPQLVRRSLQPLISSSPSTDVDDVQSDSVSKLRYMKCKQVRFFCHFLFIHSKWKRVRQREKKKK